MSNKESEFLKDHVIFYGFGMTAEDNEKIKNEFLKIDKEATKNIK
tara:strand:- start:30 stop:164 length:135 start_codon:yes stop_codon:yes gene_type:complete